MTADRTKIERFDRMILAHGPDRARWPIGERDMAEALMRESAEARALLAEAEAMEESLQRASAAPIVPGALATRITAAVHAAEAERARSLRQALAGFCGLAGASAGSVAAGLYVGALIDLSPLLSDMALIGADIAAFGVPK